MKKPQNHSPSLQALEDTPEDIDSIRESDASSKSSGTNSQHSCSETPIKKQNVGTNSHPSMEGRPEEKRVFNFHNAENSSSGTNSQQKGEESLLNQRVGGCRTPPQTDAGTSDSGWAGTPTPKTKKGIKKACKDFADREYSFKTDSPGIEPGSSFNLSERINHYRYMIKVNDVKEFIRLLKEVRLKKSQLNNRIDINDEFNDIDKLTGADLK